MTIPFYATREEIKAELDVKETARSNARIDRALADATEAVDGMTHRTFYPVVDIRKFDWPPRAGMTPWILRLDANELISVTSLTSGGVTIALGDFLLRRADDKAEPPYTRIEINLGGDASFGGGDTYQQDIVVTGLFGYRRRNHPRHHRRGAGRVGDQRGRGRRHVSRGRDRLPAARRLRADGRHRAGAA